MSVSTSNPACEKLSELKRRILSPHVSTHTPAATLRAYCSFIGHLRSSKIVKNLNTFAKKNKRISDLARKCYILSTS